MTDPNEKGEQLELFPETEKQGNLLSSPPSTVQPQPEERSESLSDSIQPHEYENDLPDWSDW